MKIATRGSKVGNAEKNDTSEDSYRTTLLWFVLKKKKRLKKGETEPVFVGSLSALPYSGKAKKLITWCLKQLQETAEWSPQNSEVPQIALHSDKW